jgi:hypothetical protein
MARRPGRPLAGARQQSDRPGPKIPSSHDREIAPASRLAVFRLPTYEFFALGLSPNIR